MKYKRLILGLLVIILLVTLMIYNFQEYDKNNLQIKKYKLLFESSDHYNNTEISFMASILWVNNTNHTLRVEIEEEPWRYPAIVIDTGNLDIQNLKKGDLIDVIGIFNGKNRMTATKLWLDEPWKADLIDLRSLPAIPFVLYSFCGHGNLIPIPGVSNGGKRMPDWLTHSLVGWITGKTTQQEIGLVVIGSLIPDIYKLYPVFDWFLKGDTQNFFLPLHTPVGAILIACVIALFFHDIKKAFILLVVGIATHLTLDLFLLNVSGGMLMLFPFSWEEWHLDLIRSDDYMITIYAIMAAVIVYLIYFVAETRIVKHAKKEIFPSAPPARVNPQLYYVDKQKHNQMEIQEPKHHEHALLEKKPTTFSEINTKTRSEFEEHLINYFIKLGYKVEKRKQNHDRDSDMLLEHQGERTIVQIKHSKKTVGIKTILEANAARNSYHCQKALVVTNTNFTTAAKQLAEQCNVELWIPKKNQSEKQKIR